MELEEQQVLLKHQGINFLILEDEQAIGEVTLESLRELGFNGKIHLANNINDARDVLAKTDHAIDFFISDWNLDELSGLDFLIEVRSLTVFEKTPFLMVTANDNVSGMLVATKKGATDYLVKPWSSEELTEKIINCLADE